MSPLDEKNIALCESAIAKALHGSMTPCNAARAAVAEDLQKAASETMTDARFSDAHGAVREASARADGYRSRAREVLES